jgi:triosephosphate isomerase (TIM)
MPNLTIAPISSANQLVDAGIEYVILGHSERRTLFGETSELVASKTKAAIDVGLTVILCVGETLEERESEKTVEVVEAQLKAVVDVLKEESWGYYIHSQTVTLSLIILQKNRCGL